MSRLDLQGMLVDIPFDGLPTNWVRSICVHFRTRRHCGTTSAMPLRTPSRPCGSTTRIFETMRLERTPEADLARKQKLFQWYLSNGLDADLDIRVPANQSVANLLSEYYRVADGRISYDQLINTRCFGWRRQRQDAVVVKLIEVLHGLIRRGGDTAPSARQDRS